MTITRKTRPDVAAPGREVGTAAIDKAAAPTTNSTRSSGKGQALKVSDFLAAGEANAHPMSYLKSILHRDSRTIRLLIEKERRQGVPILSNNQTGYYLAGNPSEIERFTRSMRHRAGEIIRTVRAIEEAAEIDRHFS